MNSETHARTLVTIMEPEAAQHLGLSRAFLRQGRKHGHGPAYIKIGRAIRYRIADLDAWLEANRVIPTPPATPKPRGIRLG